MGGQVGKTGGSGAEREKKDAQASQLKVWITRKQTERPKDARENVGG